MFIVSLTPLSFSSFLICPQFSTDDEYSTNSSNAAESQMDPVQSEVRQTEQVA